jgi:hypothetical protein
LVGGGRTTVDGAEHGANPKLLKLSIGILQRD